jgi:hypothetical protein
VGHEAKSYARYLRVFCLKDKVSPELRQTFGSYRTVNPLQIVTKTNHVRPHPETINSCPEISKGKGEGKFYPRTNLAGPEGVQMFSSTLSSTLALNGSRWSTPRPGPFTLEKDPVPIVWEAGWVPGPAWTCAE